MVNVNGTNGTNGTNGANPTAGTNGGNANFTQNGLIGADSITVNAKGGKGGKGGNRIGVGAGAAGGNGGNATIAMNGNIFNNPATNNLRVLANATGGLGGLGGTGTTTGVQGNGGNASVTLNGNIVQIAKNMNTIEFNAHATAGFGTRYGNATAIISGNVIQPNKANNVILEAFAETGGPDAPTNHGDTNFGTKIASVTGNVVQGNVSNVTLIADAGASNSTANINGNILNLTAASNGHVLLFAQGQQISVTNNKFNLGKQSLEVAISEYAPSYNSIVKNNEFTGTGTNSFAFSNNAAVPQTIKDFAIVNLLTETFTFNGDSNILKKFVNASVTGNNVASNITGDINDNILTSGDNDDLLTGGKGDDTLDGGAAIDTAIYTGNFAQYSVSFSNVGNLPGTVTDLVPNRDGSDALTNIEFLQFADGTYNVITGMFVPTGGPNTAPVANNDAFAVNEDTPLVVAAAGVLGNDTDAETDPLTATVVAGPTNGNLVLNPDGSFTYTPNANFFGVDSFTYQANDGTANSNTATVNITVNAVNDAPVATNDAYNTNEDTALVIAPVGVLGNDTDVENDPLTATVVTGPTNGILVLNPDGSFTYTPNANFNGADSFTYQANDGTANSNTATVNITVNAVNDAPPVANNDAYNTNEDTALVIAPVGVLGNDTDVDMDPLTAAVVTGPTNGNLVLNPDGSFTYTPNANFNGVDSFTYQANDGTANSNIATVNITVNAVNDAPVATNDAYNTNEDTALVIAPVGVLGNDTDVDMDPLTAAVVTGPTNGNLVLNADGSFTYTPNANFFGVDSFTYQANDGTANSNTATVNITVNPVNDAPVATNDAYNTNEDTALVIAPVGVLGNDTDVDMDPLTATVVTGPTNGNLVLNADGSFTYTPNANFNGVDSFTYQANDGTANSNTATVNITVNAVNDAPVATNDAYNTNEDAALNIAATGVLGNDTDVDGDPLTAVLVTGPTNGNLTLNPDGSFLYTPNANFFGVDSFTYQVNDGTVNSNVATVSINVAPVNDAPVANTDSYTTNMNTALIVPAATGVLNNDTDIDGDPLTVFTIITGPANGSLILNADGSFTYTPNMGYSGPDSFSYQASDGTANSNTATVNLTVNAGMTFLGTPGDDNLTGGPADDLFFATTGTDTLDGGAHINGDTVDFSNATSGVTANLDPAQQDFTSSGLGLTTILNVENLTGSGFDDVLVGDANRNTLSGGAGDDLLIATPGNDTLDGGANGAFGDTADFSDAALGGVTVDLNAQGAPQAVSAEFGNVTLNGIENLTGTDFADTLTGDAGNNRLSGGQGSDILTGGLGNDIIDGGTGIDTAVYSTQPGVANVGWNGSAFTVTGPDGTDELTNVEAIDDVGGGSKILLVGAGGYATINDAIAAANAGDTIVIAPGVYNENVLVNKSVNLVGAGPGVIVQGTFESDNAVAGDVNVFLRTGNAGAYSGAAGIGIAVSANGVTLSNITVDGFLTGVAATGANVAGLTLNGMTVQDSVFGFGKPNGTTLNGLTIDGSTFRDSYIGVYLYNDDPLQGGASNAIDTTITNTTFQDLTQKGIYAETAQGNTLFDGLIMNNVGQYGGGTPFGANGANGAGIDLNFKFNTYTGNLTISNFDFDDVGASTGVDATGHANAAAIAIKGRDDPGHALYGPNPADVTGLNVNITNGSIDGTSTGIRAGENKANPSLNVTGPAITIDGVEITNNLSNAKHDQIDNRTNSLMTVQGGVGDDVYHSAQTASSSGPIHFFGQGGNDDFRGGIGNDVFHGGADDDLLDGGNGGVDTAVFSTQPGVNDIIWNGTGYTVIGSDGIDTLTNMDVIDDVGGGSKILLVGAGGYATINAAIAAANAGDTILIAPGTYNENVNVNKSVTLMGAAPGVVIQGTFETDNAIAGDVNVFLRTGNAGAYSGAAGNGIAVSADNVTISNITVDGFLTGVAATGANVSGLTMSGVTVQDSVFGFGKPNGTTLTNLLIEDSAFVDSYIGVYLYNDNPALAGASDAINTTITNTTFLDLTQKGIYAETAQGTTLFDGLIMNNVGQYGGGTPFGANGANGSGIDLNFKFNTYAGDVTISNFDFLNVGSSTGVDPNGHANAAAIAVKGRDEPNHGTYGPNPADVSDLTVTIANGTIDGTSTGIRAGEAGKPDTTANVSGPAVTVQNVTIENNLSNANHDQFDNRTGSLMTVTGNNQANVLHVASTVTSTGPVRLVGLGGADDLLGGNGNDILQGGTGNDILDGGAGNDTADYSDATSNNLNVNLNTGVSSGGGRGSDTLFNIENALGSGFNDKLTGNAGVNMLVGGGGNDQLSGGGGNDILWGGAGDDTITGGGGAGDVAYFSGHEWEYTTVSLTNVDGLDGNDTLATVERLKFLAPDHVSDINNDGYGDLLYYRASDGKLNTITSDGTGTEAVTAVGGTFGATWRAVGTGVFRIDTNRNSSLLLQDTATGNLEIWRAGANSASTLLTTQPGSADWNAVAVGDFDGDGASDVLIHNSTLPVPQTQVMFLGGNAQFNGAVTAVTAVDPVPVASGFVPVASGDFNGDGKSDILWRKPASTDGDVRVTLMDGARIVEHAIVAGPGAGYTAYGTGDFDADGKSDILFTDAAGDALIWTMDGTAHTGTSGLFAKPSAGSVLRGAEDYNRDGVSDLLWQDGAASRVQLVNPNLTAGSLININNAPGATFTLVGSSGGG